MQSARPGKRRVARRYAVGVPNSSTSACAISVVLKLTISASVTTGFESWSISCPGGTRKKIASTGSARNASVIPAAAKYATASSALRMPTSVGSGRKPAASSFFWPALLRTSLMNFFAAVLCVLEDTTAIAYVTFGCAQAGILMTFTFPGTVLASVE